MTVMDIVVTLESAIHTGFIVSGTCGKITNGAICARALKSRPTRDFTYRQISVVSLEANPEYGNVNILARNWDLSLAFRVDMSCLSKYLYGPSRMVCNTSSGVLLHICIIQYK